MNELELDALDWAIKVTPREHSTFSDYIVSLLHEYGDALRQLKSKSFKASSQQTNQ